MKHKKFKRYIKNTRDCSEELLDIYVSIGLLRAKIEKLRLLHVYDNAISIIRRTRSI